MSNNIKYWISILIGFLLVLVMYKNSAKFLENFTIGTDIDPKITPDGNGSGGSKGESGPHPSKKNKRDDGGESGPQPSKKTDTTTTTTSSSDAFLTLPYPDKLLLYFNSFNVESNPAITNRNTTYQCQNNYWCDTKTTTIKYFLNGQNVPATIDNIGLPMKNIMIQGPASYSLVNVSNNYHLNSFTVIFYLNFNTISFDTDAEIILYEMFAESPNNVRIIITEIPNDSNNVEINVIVGPTTLIYSWVIPITTLLSNGNTTLYSLVYDEDQLLLTFYIGVGKNIYTATLDKKPQIILGLTPLEINKNRNLDAFLSAFCYYNYPLSRTDMEAVNKFFIQESSSIYLLQTTLSSLKSSLSSQNNALLNQLNTTSQRIHGLQDKISSLEGKSCPSPQNTAPAARGRHWHIDMDNVSSVNDKDLQQCSPLTLKEFDIEIPKLPIPNIQATANLVKNTLTSPPPPPPPPPPPRVTPSTVTYPNYDPNFNDSNMGPSSMGPSGGVRNTFYGTYSQQAQQQNNLTNG